MSEIVEVVLADRQGEDFIDHRREVSQGANGGQGRRVVGAEETAGGGENERVFDGNQWHSSLVKCSSNEAVMPADGSCCARSFTISIQDDTDILFPACLVSFQDSSISLADREATGR